MKTYEIKTRCVDEPCQYHTLRLTVDGVITYVHASAKMSYLLALIPAGYVKKTS